MEDQKKRWLNIIEIKHFTRFSIVDKYREMLLPSLPQNLETIQLKNFHISTNKSLLSKQVSQPRYLIFTTQESIDIPFGLIFI